MSMKSAAQANGLAREPEMGRWGDGEMGRRGDILRVSESPCRRVSASRLALLHASDYHFRECQAAPLLI